MIVLIIILILLAFAIYPKLHYKKKRYTYLKNRDVESEFREEIIFEDENIKELYLIGTDNFKIHTKIYKVENPSAIVQMIHGANEHMGRYGRLIETLLENNYLVIISDNRGHGHSVDENYPPGFFNGIEEVVDDNYKISRYIKKQYPNLPLYLYGHSLGSIISRLYLKEYDDEIEKLVLTGTPNYVSIVGIGVFIAQIYNFYGDTHGFSHLLKKLY